MRLDQVVLRALEQNPELRFQQVSEVKTMVETIVQSSETPPPPSPVAGGEAPFTNKHYKAPWGQGLVLSSRLHSAVTPIAFKYLMQGCSSVLIGTSSLALIFGPALFTIRGYTITPEAILIHRLFWATRLPLGGLVSARFEMGAMQWSIRFFMGGLFAFTGFRYHRRFGFFRVFATDLMRTVVLRYAKRIVIVSPADPEAFVRDVTAAMAQTKTQPSSKEH